MLNLCLWESLKNLKRKTGSFKQLSLGRNSGAYIFRTYERLDVFIAGFASALMRNAYAKKGDYYV